MTRAPSPRTTETPMLGSQLSPWIPTADLLGGLQLLSESNYAVARPHNLLALTSW